MKKTISNFIVLCCSPSQSQDTFESFIDHLELNIDAIAANNPYLIGILGDLLNWVPGVDQINQLIRFLELMI